MLKKNCVSYHTNINFRPGIKELVVLDEGDYWIFGQSKLFNSFSKHAKLVALSATSDGGDAEGSEA